MGSDVLKTNRWFLLFGLTLGVLFAFSVLSSKPVLAAPGINQEINFQGRLLNSQGATVPDGYYNIEFKIYQDGNGQSVGDSTGSPSGSLKWTEDYLNDNSQGVEVVNGYLSVELGSINPFGSSIDWNQSTLWLSMNIGNTPNASCSPFSSCSPDGEMVPMQPLTSAVYALNANELGGVTASAFGQLASNQTWTGTNLVQPTTNITGLEVQQTSAGSPTADIFDVQGTGGSADNFIQVTSTAANQGSVNISSLGSSNAVTLTSGSDSLAINNTVSAFTGNVTTTGTINSQTISSTASFSGTLNVATGYQIAGGATTGNYLRGNGTNFVSSAIQVGDLPSGSTYYINNTTSPQNSNFDVVAATSGSVAGSLQANSSGTGDILDLLNGTPTKVLTVSSAGNLLVEPSSNSNAAMLIENSSGKAIFRVNTSSNSLTLGNVTSVSGNNETGSLVFADGSIDNFGLTLNTATLTTSSATISFPNTAGAGGTVCLQSSPTCGFAATPASGGYIQTIPTSTAANTVAPTVGAVVGLTVNGTTGGAATAVNIIQGGAAADLTASNTASTSGNLVSLTQSTSAYTGTAILLNLANGSGSFSGNFLDLQKNGSSEFKVDNAGNVTEAGTLQGTSLDGTTGINTGATGGTQRIDSSGNLVNIGTIATSGGINGQTISAAANFSGTVNVATGYQIAGGATTGNYLRGNGTNFVSSAIQVGDLPSLQGTYISNVPTSTANNTIAPTAASVVGLTVNGTSGTAATAVNIVQGYAASNLSLSNTGATSSNLVSLTQSTSAYTGTAILLNLANGSGSFSGNFINLEKNSTSEFSVDNAGDVADTGTLAVTGAVTGGTYNSQTISSAASFTGTLAVASTINSQTISSASSFTGTVNVATGYQVGGVAATGQYLRGNGTNFVSSAIQVGDLPSLSGTYLSNVPGSTAANTVAPTVGAVVGLTVNGTTGGAATAVNIIQGGAAADLTASNTASTSGNLVSLTQSTSAYTGTAILLNLANGSGSFSGNFLDLQKNGSSEFKVDNAGNVTEAGTLQGTSLDGTTGINTGATGGTQRIDSSGNLVNIGTIATSGGINGQTISAAANFSGTVNVATGYQIAGGATTGNYLRGNGTNFVSSAIQVGDLPSLQGTYISNVPTSTANNTIAPTAASVVGLTVNGTSGTAATAVNIVQGYAASNLSLSNTGATSSNLVSLTQSTSAYTGTAILLNLANGSGSFSGNFLDLQKNGSSEFKVDNAGNVTNLGTINSQTISSAANFTGTLAVASTVTGGTYNSQTISAAASFTGTLSVATGYRVAGVAATGQYLRGNGTNFVSSAIQVGDLPSLSGTYLSNVPGSTAANTVAPTVGAVVGLTVNGTTGGAATAVNIIQGGAAADLTASNTASTSGNLVSLTQSTSAYTGTAILLNLANGSGSFSGNFLDLQKNGSSEFKVDNAGNVTEAGTLQGTSLDGTTGINTGATGGTQRIDSSGNLVNIGTIATSGGINGQTISAAANFSGTVNVATGYQIAGGATTGNYLRGNGTNFVSSAIQVGDLPSLQGTYISNVPTSTANNTIAPTAASVVGLTVNGTSGTAATALNIIQGGAAAGIGVTSSTTGDGEDVSLTNITGIQTNGIYVDRNASGGTTTNLLNLTNTLGTATNAITLSGTFANDLINSTNFSVTNGGSLSAVGVDSGSGSLQGTGGLSLTGTANINTSGSAATSIGNSGSTVTIASSGLNVTALGAVSGVTTLSTSSTINGQTISNAASFTGTLAVASSVTGGTYNTDTLTSNALTFTGASPVISASTSNAGMTLQANGTGTLLLDTTGAGTVNIGSSAVNINVGGGSSNETVGVGNSSGNDTVNISTNTGTNGINIGTNTSAADTIDIGSSNASTALTLQGGSGGTAVGIQAASAGTINIATSNNNNLNLGTGTTTDAIVLGGTGTSGNITLGQWSGTTGTETISLGSNVGNGGTQAINIGTSSTTGSTSNVTIGSTIAGATKIQAATVTQTIQGGSVSIQSSTTNNTSVFQVQDTIGDQLLNIDTTTSNLVVNPSIEESISGNWTAKGTGATVTQNASQQYIGNDSLSIATTTTANAGAQESLTLVANTTYTLSMYVKSYSASISTINIGRQDVSGTDVDCLTGQTINDSTWTELSCSFTTGATITSSNIYIKNTGTNGTFYIDAVQLTRFSLLSDPSFEQAISGSWTGYGGVTPTQSTAQAKDGTHSLSIVDTTTGQGGEQAITLNASTQYFLSFWATGTTSFSTLNVGYSSTGVAGGEVDCLTAQTVNTTWTQYNCNFTTPSSTSGTPYMYFKDTGSGHTWYIDAVELTLGSPSTIYTAGAPAAGSFITGQATEFNDGNISLNGVITSPVTIDTGISGVSGLQLTQIAASAGCSGYCDLLGINTSGQIGLSNAAVSLTSPALAYWDGLNDPTSSDQSYPTDPIATYTCTGTCTGAGGTGGFNSGAGELLNPAQANTYGSLNWSFAQVQFEEIQFQVKTTACSLNCTGLTSGADASWFYGYASGAPTTEFGCDVAVGSCNGTNNISDGYIVYFSEYHDCIGIAYAYYADGNQCNNGGGTSGAGTSPLASVAMPAGAINDANWHNVDIQILDNKIYVRWDGQLVLSYTDVYNRDLTDYQDFGFGSRSGGDVDNHYVKGLLVTKLANASAYNVDAASPLASNLYWNDSTSNLGVNTSTPHSDLEVDGTAALEPTVGGEYNAGTACQSNSGTSCATTAGTLVFGTGTTWSSNVAAGDTITFSNGETGRITTVNSNTELTVSSSQLIPSGSTYSINQGTACQSSSTTSCGATAGTAIFGTNTDFTSSMVGDIINWPDGDTGVITGYTSATKLTVSGTSQLQAGSTYTIEAGGLTVSNATTSTIANVTIGANSTFGGKIINDTETTTGTNTYNTAGVEQDAAYGYNFYTNLGSTTATADTFNITGLPSTEGTTAFIESELTAAGTNTQSITVQINGTTMSTISKATAGTYYDDYIVMYSGSAWRIIGQGALTGQTLPTGYTQGIDYAEWIPYSGNTQPQPGDVLSVGSSDSSVSDSSTPYDPALLGVVSTQPYEVAGTDDGHSVIIALTGRVPVSVSLANGPIEAGDPLTSSSIPGVAVKATEPGNIIGTALESYDGTQTSNQIMVQLHVGFDDPTAGSGQLQGDQSINGDLTVSGNTALQGSMTINGGVSVDGNSTMSSLMVGNTLNVDGNLTVNGTAAINNLESQTATISGQFSAGNSTLASLLIANDLTVNGNITVNGTATIGNLNVSGSTSTQNLAVSGTTSLAGDIKLTGSVNTQQAIIKTFMASRPIASGNAVIIDNTPGNAGDVTTTTTPDDPRVIGVAVTAAASAGDTIQVAIGGWVQVRVDTSTDVNGNPPAPITPGQLIVTSDTAGTIQASANPVAGSILGKSTSNQDPNNLVWIIITLQ